MSDIERVERDWNKNVVNCCIKAGFRSQREFANAFKQKYGACTQTNISRWVNVGGKCSRGKDGKEKTRIGFPSYETMLKIADFFGVSVGYLTGETNYNTFDAEKACGYFGVDQETGDAIRKIAMGIGGCAFDAERSRIRMAVLKHLLSAKEFLLFLDLISFLADDIYTLMHPFRYFGEEISDVENRIQEIAVDDLDAGDEDVTEEISEFLEAIKRERYAQGIDDYEKQQRDDKVALAKYRLYEVYIRLIDQVVQKHELQDLIVNIELEDKKHMGISFDF